jgi:hypothetical protein
MYARIWGVFSRRSIAGWRIPYADTHGLCYDHEHVRHHIVCVWMYVYMYKRVPYADTHGLCCDHEHVGHHIVCVWMYIYIYIYMYKRVPMLILMVYVVTMNMWDTILYVYVCVCVCVWMYVCIYVYTYKRVPYADTHDTCHGYQHVAHDMYACVCTYIYIYT